MLFLTPLLLVLVVALVAHSTIADHVRCSYKPGNASPSYYGYQKFCDAVNRNRNKQEPHMIYACSAGNAGAPGAAVAEYEIRDNAMEFSECQPSKIFRKRC